MPSSPPHFPVSEWVASNALAFAVRAPASRSPGHTIIVPRRPLASYFVASPEEKAALWALVDATQAALDELLHPDGYEVGFTAGEVAGSIAPFAYIDVIPRFRQTLDDPLDVVRQRPAVRSTDGPRTTRCAPVATGGDHDPLSHHLAALFANATDIAIVAAFVTETGLALLENWVLSALRAGASLRIVTGDYLAFNQVDALRQLRGWSQLDVPARDEPLAAQPRGQLRVRIVETAHPDGSERAFHPKSWLFESPSSGVAFVGSSNVSRSALETGIEWNLRVERAIDPIAYASVHTVERLWLTAGRADRRRDRGLRPARPPGAALPAPGDADAEPLEPPPVPHELQQEALLKLASAREQGRRRALALLALDLMAAPR